MGKSKRGTATACVVRSLSVLPSSGTAAPTPREISGGGGGGGRGLYTGYLLPLLLFQTTSTPGFSASTDAYGRVLSHVNYLIKFNCKAILTPQRWDTFPNSCKIQKLYLRTSRYLVISFFDVYMVSSRDDFIPVLTTGTKFHKKR